MSVAKSNKAKKTSSKAKKPAETAEEFADELKPGTKLLQGQYTIDSFLNSGGFGITYLARDSLDRRIVIKECFPGAFCRRSNTIVGARSRAHQNEFASIVKLFVQEAMSLSKIVHPNIVGVHQVFEDNDTAYMAIDYVDGLDMAQIVEDKKMTFTPERIEYMLRKLLNAVGFIHDKGMLHRDISPDNILVDQDQEPILIDFGAARKHSKTTGRALSAMRVVKDGYSPQEFYVTGAEQNESSDLYALSASFYHLITGDVPADSQTRLASIAEGRADPYLPLAGRIKGYPEGFLESLDTAINVLPKRRLQSAQEWLDLLDGASDGAQKEKPGRTVHPVAAKSKTGGSSKGILFGSVAVAALAAATGFVVLNPDVIQGGAEPAGTTVSTETARATTPGAEVQPEPAPTAISQTSDTEPAPEAVTLLADGAVDAADAVAEVDTERDTVTEGESGADTVGDTETELSVATSAQSGPETKVSNDSIVTDATTDVADLVGTEQADSTESTDTDLVVADITDQPDVGEPVDVVQTPTSDDAAVPSVEDDKAAITEQVTDDILSEDETTVTDAQAATDEADIEIASPTTEPDPIQAADAGPIADSETLPIQDPEPAPEPELAPEPEPAPVLLEAAADRPNSVFAKVAEMITPIFSRSTEQDSKADWRQPVKITEPRLAAAIDAPVILALNVPEIVPEPAPEPVPEDTVALSDATDNAEPVPAAPTTTIAKNQVIYSTWTFDLPFQVSYRSIDGSGIALITGIKEEGFLAAQNPWVKRGVAIFTVDGQPVSEEATLETLIAQTGDPSSVTLAKVPVRIKSALNRKFEQHTLVASARKTVALKQGVTFAVSFDGDQWLTTIDQVDDGAGQTLLTGDILRGETSSGQSFVEADSLETVLAELAALGKDAAQLDILRNGESLIQDFALARDK